MVSFIEKQLGWQQTKPGTAGLHIHGYEGNMNWNDPFYFYGSDARLIKDRINATEADWISETLKIHSTQVQWAVENEMARTVEDVLSRRTRVLLLDAAESVRICREVAGLMAVAMNKDEAWIEKEVRDYSRLAQQYILKQQQPSLLKSL
jgi:glycerol-3-phosphate dehydrogenase